MATKTLEQLVALPWDEIACYIQDRVSDPIKASCLVSIINNCRHCATVIPKWREEFSSKNLPAMFEDRVLHWFGFEDAMKKSRCWKFNTYAIEFLAIEQMEPGSEMAVPDFSFFVPRVPEVLAAEIVKRGYKVILQKDSGVYDVIIAHAPDLNVASINFDLLPTAILCDISQESETGASSSASSNLRAGANLRAEPVPEMSLTCFESDIESAPREEFDFSTPHDDRNDTRQIASFISLQQQIKRVQGEIGFLLEHATDVQPEDAEEYRVNLQRQYATLADLNSRLDNPPISRALHCSVDR